MAQLDLSNAHIEPYSTRISGSEWLGFGPNYGGELRNSSGNSITGNAARSVISSTTSSFKLHYSGTFTASGIEFYFFDSPNTWRVTGVSFESGDTYSFTVKANIVLNQ